MKIASLQDKKHDSLIKVSLRDLKLILLTNILIWWIKLLIFFISLVASKWLDMHLMNIMIIYLYESLDANKYINIF